MTLHMMRTCPDRREWIQIRLHGIRLGRGREFLSLCEFWEGGSPYQNTSSYLFLSFICPLG